MRRCCGQTPGPLQTAVKVQDAIAPDAIPGTAARPLVNSHLLQLMLIQRIPIDVTLIKAALRVATSVLNPSHAHRWSRRRLGPTAQDDLGTR